MRIRRTPQAFSLIELLTVVAVIGIVVSILIPALSRSRSLAKDIQCKASLRSIGSAFQLYAGDHEGHLPAAKDVGEAGSGYWYVQVAPYLSSRADDSNKTAEQKRSIVIGAVAVCPEAFFPQLNIDPKGMGASYGWNNIGGVPFGSGQLLESIESPGRTILLGERWAKNSSKTRDSDYHVKPPWGSAPLNSELTQEGADPARLRLSHGGRSNYLFFDGHVESYSPDQTYNPANPQAAPNLWRGL